ncbi:two pore calcium channel protein 1-like [Branchiostoma lanceolatum]|uniref:two pore calcium channel protein 1-like n=1 Tax=Branchiostoma lanceolatum TaxID=7740 RepID=UPI003453DE10
MNLYLAATYIRDARYGRNGQFETDDNSVRLYNLYNHWLPKGVAYFFILLLLALAIFEKPAVPGLEIEYYVTMPMEVICLIVIGSRLFHLRRFSPGKTFYSDKKNLVVMATMIVVVIDMISYIALVNSGQAMYAYRWSRPLRALLLVNITEGRQIRRAFRNIRRTLPDILNVLVLFFLSIALFALMALKIFERRPELRLYTDDSPYFKQYGDIYFQLYVLVTTANSPDIMMPAFDSNKWFSLFFIVYLVVCLYLFMSIILAVIYKNYRKHLKNEIKKSVFIKRFKLLRAFDELKEQVEGKSVVTEKTWNAVMKEVLPNRTHVYYSLLWMVLDKDVNGYIDRKMFLQVADLLNVEVSEVRNQKHLIEKYYPHIYNSSVSIAVRQVVMHKFFRYFFDLAIVVNAFFIGFNLDEAEWFFLSVFTCEIILKLYTYGFREFCRRFWNIFDFIVISAAFIATVIEAALEELQYSRETLDVLLVLRILRLLKLVGSIDRFKIIIGTLTNIAPSMFTYGGVLFVFYYVFAIIGMEVWGTMLSGDPNVSFCNNSNLNGSEFARDHYCNNNFSDILTAFVLLFELMVVNQWHVLTSGFVAITSAWARLYFVAFHLLVVIVVLNIFLAFILEAFMLESSLSAGKFSNAVEEKIKEMGLWVSKKPLQEQLPVEHVQIEAPQSVLVDNIEVHPSPTPPPAENETAEAADVVPEMKERRPRADTGLRFRIARRGTRKTEILLQRMFESELLHEEGQEMPTTENEIEEMEPEEIRPTPLTLDNVT